jgi:hypothetical protein
MVSIDHAVLTGLQYRKIAVENGHENKLLVASLVVFREGRSQVV